MDPWPFYPRVFLAFDPIQSTISNWGSEIYLHQRLCLQLGTID